MTGDSDNVSSLDEGCNFLEWSFILVLSLVAEDLEFLSVSDDIDEYQILSLTTDGLDSASDGDGLVQELVVFNDGWIVLISELDDVVLNVEFVRIREWVFGFHQILNLLASDFIVFGRI